MITIPRPADTFVNRLNKAILAHDRLMQPLWEKNKAMLRASTGGYYMKGHSGRMQPLKMVDRAVSIWQPFLCSGNPKCVVEPVVNLTLKPFAYTFQLAINQWIEKMNFDQRVLEPAILSSFFSRGIIKTGTAKGEDAELLGETAATGVPFAEVVDDCNYVFDIAARDRSHYEFEGDRYVLPTDAAKEMYPKYADKISTDFEVYGDQDVKNLENPDRVPYGELREYTEFIDLYLPKEKVIITILPPDKDCKKIIRTMPYKGPDDGPYDVLGYKYIPGSTIPVPPVHALMELDTAINTIYTKARQGAESLKKVGVYEGGNEKDAKTAKEAAYGDMIGLNNAAAVKEITLGGVVPELWDFLGFTLNQYSEQSGITGLDYRSRAKTLGQEQMLMSNSTRVLDYMNQKVQNFTSSVMRKLAFEIWRNPSIRIEAVMKISGIGDIGVSYSQIEQEGEFPDYKFTIEAYSMQRTEPEERFQKMMQLLTGWVLPTMEIARSQGKTPNIPEITKTLSLYQNIETDSWFLSEPGLDGMSGGGQMGNYQPTGFSTNMKSSDQRFGSNPASNANNALQHQNKMVGTSK